MATLKTTKRPKASVQKFLKGIEHDRRRGDAMELCSLIEKVTKLKPVMWGEKMVGFGSYAYTRKGKKDEFHEWFVIGFAPGKAAVVLHSPPCFPEYKKLVASLGTVKSSVSCTYITDLSKIDQEALKELISASVAAGKKLDERKG